MKTQTNRKTALHNPQVAIATLEELLQAEPRVSKELPPKNYTGCISELSLILSEPESWPEVSEPISHTPHTHAIITNTEASQHRTVSYLCMESETLEQYNLDHHTVDDEWVNEQLERNLAL